MFKLGLTRSEQNEVCLVCFDLCVLDLMFSGEMICGSHMLFFVNVTNDIHV